MSATVAGVDWDRLYRETLADYLARGDEEALIHAYELGRRALAGGLGVLDVAALHQQALAALVPSIAAAPESGGGAAFLREALSPFEMSFRGYREANEELRRLNRTLASQRDDLERLNRELESFSYSVSHDLRAPLRSIDGFSQALLEDCGDRIGPEGQRYLGYVREAAQHMAQLIDDLLSLSRVTRGELYLAPVDLSSIARRIGERLRASDPGREVELVIQDGVVARGDARLLAVALENLLGNAWKFTSKKERARIEFGARREGDRTVYFVRDDGAGFDMAFANKLFGAFQRLHSTKEFEGTGIGLATVQRVIARHGGRIWAEGAVGAGATFSFTLGTSE